MERKLKKWKEKTINQQIICIGLTFYYCFEKLRNLEKTSIQYTHIQRGGGGVGYKGGLGGIV